MVSSETVVIMTSHHHLMFSNAQNAQTEYHIDFHVCGLVYSYVLRRHCDNEIMFSNAENVFSNAIDSYHLD
jgi:hypothetical protein